MSIITETKPISSLEGVEILPGRRVGNTTRIVDNAIQLLFKGETVRIEDHYPTNKAKMDLAHRIMDRMYEEHRARTEYDISKGLLKLR